MGSHRTDEQSLICRGSFEPRKLTKKYFSSCQESDGKNKKTITGLKDDLKVKERDFKKSEAELTRTKEKVGQLEEKIQAVKADFKARESEAKESHEKVVAGVEEKVRDLRSRLNTKDDDFNQVDTINTISKDQGIYYRRKQSFPVYIPLKGLPLEK